MGGTYELYIHGDGRAVCPFCAGLMRTAEAGEYIQCHDCHKVLIRIGDTGFSEKMMQYEGVTI